MLPLMSNGVHRSFPIVHPDRDPKRSVVAVNRWIRQHFVQQSHSLYSAMNVIDAIFAVNAPNVRLNRISMQMPMIQMVYRLCLLKMVHDLVFFPSEN